MLPDIHSALTIHWSATQVNAARSACIRPYYSDGHTRLTDGASPVQNSMLWSACERSTMSLFEDCERTHLGRSRLHESEYSYLKRSARPRAIEACELCERWFAEYESGAPVDELKHFVRRFRSKRPDQHHGAWFELLVHHLLLRLGLAVCVRTRPDFIAISDGHRVLVEATAAGVRREISHYEDDALQKLADLKSENFYVSIEEAEGRLSRELKRPVLLDPFKRFIQSHDPDEVQRLVAGLGESARPRCTISFDGWRLSVSLWPASPAHRRPRDNRVNPPPPSRSNYSPVMDARRSIEGKLAKYGRVDDMLVLAVTVYNLWPQDLSSVANEAVFGTGGIWHGKGSLRPTPAAVLFFSNTRPYAVQSIASCLYVNPSINSAELPPALLDLPHTKGSNGVEGVEGKSVAEVLGLPPA